MNYTDEAEKSCKQAAAHIGSCLAQDKTKCSIPLPVLRVSGEKTLA